jgi:hypothetical protein
MAEKLDGSAPPTADDESASDSAPVESPEAAKPGFWGRLRRKISGQAAPEASGPPRGGGRAGRGGARKPFRDPWRGRAEGRKAFRGP